MAERLRIFSGIQPTGRKHLGNYIGAIRQYLQAQAEGEALYCLVDLHALTVPYDPAALRRSLYDLTALLLACGLDPTQCILFRQSDVTAHTELCWLLSCLTELGRLQRMHQFRDKSLRARELVSAGLLLYPVLQAADVLAYRAQVVPVGEDQREHLELMRDIARRFNARFGSGRPVLVVPEHRIPAVGARIMDLQNPAAKMTTTGGSEEGTVYLLDPPKVITRKVRRAVTDSGQEVRRDPAKAGVTNLIEILAAVSGIPPEEVEARYGEGGYGRLKEAVAEALTALLVPIQERYKALRPDERHLEQVLAEGAMRAQAIAKATVEEVREAMGVGPPRQTATVGGEQRWS